VLAGVEFEKELDKGQFSMLYSINGETALHVQGATEHMCSRCHLASGFVLCCSLTNAHAKCVRDVITEIGDLQT
jgi:hypothetical protein